MTPFIVEPLSVPVHQNEYGEIHVANTRVLLDSVIDAWKEGVSPEMIVRDYYDTLQLADVYAVLAYYLAHQEQVEQYLREHDEELDRLRQEQEASGLATPWPEFRALVATRQATKAAEHAAPRQ